MIRQRRHVSDGTGMPGTAERHLRPVRLEAELLVRPSEALDIVSRGKIRLAINPTLLLQLGERTPARVLQRPINQLARRHGKAGMLSTEASRQRADHLVIGATLTGRLDQLWPEQNVLMPAALIDVVMLEEHGRRQHNVCHARGLGHKLLMYAREQIFARKAAFHQFLLGTHGNRIGVLDQHRGHWRTAAERRGLAAQDWAEARLIQHSDRWIDRVEAFDHGALPVKDRAVVVKSPAALVAPRADDRSDAARGMHVGGAVARAREAVTEAEKGALAFADHACERLDCLNVAAGDA